LLLFVVDASGSMAAWRRMRRTKAAILALLEQAYQRRDRVALLLFRGVDTELVLPPTASMAKTRRALDELAVGGTTPLADGLAATRRFILNQQRRQRRLAVWTVILTDGRGNVPLSRQAGTPSNGNAPWTDALHQASLLAGCDADLHVIDTEIGWPRFGRAAELSAALGAEYRPLDDVLGQRVGCIGAGNHTDAVPREAS
jgi:magnesium chelatase subunit D